MQEVEDKWAFGSSVFMKEEKNVQERKGKCVVGDNERVQLVEKEGRNEIWYGSEKGCYTTH